MISIGAASGAWLTNLGVAAAPIESEARAGALAPRVGIVTAQQDSRVVRTLLRVR